MLEFEDPYGWHYLSIAIIIPAFNGERFLEETLRSIVAQTVTTWTLTIVDDGSTDSTLAIAKAFSLRDPRVKVVVQVNGRVAAARNNGFAISSHTCDYVMFLDQDDVLEPNALLDLSRALDTDSACPAAHGMARIVDEDGPITVADFSKIQNMYRRTVCNGEVVTVPPEAPTTHTMIVYDNLICTPGTALLRRSSLNTILERYSYLFDSDDVPLDDWGFWLRVTDVGDIRFVNKVVLNWRRHSEAGSMNVAAMRAAEIRLRKKILRDSSELPELKRVANDRFEKLLATNERRKAKDCLREAANKLNTGNVMGACTSAASALRLYAKYLARKSKN